MAAARVCQDILLRAISLGPMKNNVTIKGGIVMRSITNNVRRSTRDIDLDFIHYPLSDAGINEFVAKMNCIEGVTISINSNIEELKHQDYHGKSIRILISDDNGYSVSSKLDIGVHKNIDITQEEYCFDVCIDEGGASLLKNTSEQIFVEKLRSLLIFGQYSRRYKDFYDLCYLKDIVDKEKLNIVLSKLIFNDASIRENGLNDVINRVETVYKDKQYLKRVAESSQRWLDGDVAVIANNIVGFLRGLQ